MVATSSERIAKCHGFASVSITCVVCVGISCPRAARITTGQGVINNIEGDPFGNDALQFTKDLVLQREVEVEVESMDKAGNFIGWMFIDDKNLSVALVEVGKQGLQCKTLCTV